MAVFGHKNQWRRENHVERLVQLQVQTHEDAARTATGCYSAATVCGVTVQDRLKNIDGCGGIRTASTNDALAAAK
jgi:hypothetical protein